MPPTRVNGLHIAWVEGDAVLLDVVKDAYSCVIAADRARPGRQPAADVLVALRARGVVGEVPNAASGIRDVPQVAWRDIAVPTGAGLSGVVAAAFAASLLTASLRFLCFPLTRITAAGLAENTGVVGDLMTMARAVEQFERLSIFLPFRPACLFRSLFLRQFLALRGHATSWVFGVQLFPFRAHCWLAVGDAVIGDAAHRVLAYVPILTVEPA
jgi:hypothetical protein